MDRLNFETKLLYEHQRDEELRHICDLGSGKGHRWDPNCCHYDNIDGVTLQVRNHPRNEINNLIVNNQPSTWTVPSIFYTLTANRKLSDKQKTLIDDANDNNELQYPSVLKLHKGNILLRNNNLRAKSYVLTKQGCGCWSREWHYIGD